MLLLTSTSDSLSVVTSAAVSTDAAAMWEDQTTNVPVPRSRAVAISTATTTLLVGSPEPTVQRIVKALHVRNKHATTQQDVTIQMVIGGVTVDLYKASLLAGESLQYQAGSGFWICDAQGRPKDSNSLYTPAVNQLNVVILTSDVTNNNAVANTIQDVTGLSFATVSGQTYWFRASISYTAAATTTGSRWSVNTTGGAPTMLRYKSEYSLSTTTNTVNEGLTAVDSPAASNASSAATGANTAILEGNFTAGANGTFIIRFASEVLSSAIVAKAGSILEWIRVL